MYSLSTTARGRVRVNPDPYALLLIFPNCLTRFEAGYVISPHRTVHMIAYHMTCGLTAPTLCC